MKVSFDGSNFGATRYAQMHSPALQCDDLAARIAG